MKKIAFVAYPAIVALSLLAGTLAHAQSESLNLAPTGPSASGLTRAEVRAELFKARTDGSLRVWESNFSPLLVASSSQRTRAEVQAEAVAANRSNHAARWYGEDSGSIAMSHPGEAIGGQPVFAKVMRKAR